MHSVRVANILTGWSTIPGLFSTLLAYSKSRTIYRPCSSLSLPMLASGVTPYAAYTLPVHGFLEGWGLRWCRGRDWWCRSSWGGCSGGGWSPHILSCELLSLHHNVLLIYPAVNTNVPGLCKIYLLFGREPTVLLKHTEDDI